MESFSIATFYIPGKLIEMF